MKLMQYLANIFATTFIFSPHKKCHKNMNCTINNIELAINYDVWDIQFLTSNDNHVSCIHTYCKHFENLNSCYKFHIVHQ